MSLINSIWQVEVIITVIICVTIYEIVKLFKKKDGEG